MKRLVRLAISCLIFDVATLGVTGSAANAQGINLNVGGSGGASVSVGGGGANVSVGTSGGGSNLTSGATNGSNAASGGGSSTTDQQAALEAVQNHLALPLDKILEIAHRHTKGEIIDAQLIKVRGFLLYDIKVLDVAGNVNHLYFYAWSGRIVKSD